jgi:glycosyltransferase involved in cell wall biosynthesis
LKHEAYKFVIKSAVKNSATIITPTNAVKEDIQKTFGDIRSDKIDVTYEGIREDIMKTPSRDDLKKKLTKPFFLYVGNFYPHKNIKHLLEAFSQFTEKFDLVLVGPNDFFAKKLQIKDSVRLFTNIETQDLVYLYKNAEALIHPSLYEGFGLPLLEATYFNLPVIASNIDVFKEILGDSYLSFDPQSPADIAEKIGRFVRDKSIVHPPTKEDLVNKFSFRKMTEQTLSIYEKLL